MMRKLTLFLIISAAAVAQDSKTTDKPAPKVSAATVKVVPQSAKASAKPSRTVKVNTAPKPAVIAVQPAPAKVSAPAATKPVAVSAAKPLVAVKASPTPAAKPAIATKASAAPAAKPTVAAKASTVPAAKPTVAVVPKSNAAVPATTAAPAKAANNSAKVVPVAAKATPLKAASAKPVTVSAAPSKGNAKQPVKQVGVPVNSKAQGPVAVKDSGPAQQDKKPVAKSVNANGRRDPFISPVVNMSASGSGCSSGKRCLAIDQIALRGIVKADTGMIAVVVNAMDKAYFLRENDPVFNGYVVKITGDSIVFKETFHDRLGKTLTRDVTKSITRPVA